MTGNDVFYGLRMRRHMVGAVQSAQDPHASVHCTNEAGRVRSHAPSDASCHCLVSLLWMWSCLPPNTEPS